MLTVVVRCMGSVPSMSRKKKANDHTVKNWFYSVKKVQQNKSQIRYNFFLFLCFRFTSYHLYTFHFVLTLDTTADDGNDVTIGTQYVWCQMVETKRTGFALKRLSENWKRQIPIRSSKRCTICMLLFVFVFKTFVYHYVFFF